MKLVQITDTHLLGDPARAYRGWHTWRSFEAVLNQVLERHADLDGLLLTGDLVHDESVQGYRLLAGELHRSFVARDIPVWAIPGNHDAPPRLQAIFSRYGIQTRMHSTIAGWRLLLLSSHLPGQISGVVDPAQRLRALNLLRSNPDLPTLLCIHHPPVDIGSAWLDALGLAQRERLRALCDAGDVRAVICGHVHQAQQLSAAHLSAPVLTCPSTCRQFLPGSRDFAEDTRPPGYRVFQLSTTGDIKTRVERLPYSKPV